MYTNVEQIFDKYVEMDMDDEISKNLKEIFETMNTNENEASLKKAIEIMRNLKAKGIDIGLEELI